MIGLDYAINIKDGSFGAISKAKTETEGLDHAVKNTNEGFGKLGEKIGEIGKMIVAAFAVEKVIEFGKQSFEVFEKIEQGEAQLNAGIASTAGIAGRSLEELVDTAKKFTETTLFNEEDTMQAEKLILTFTNIRGKIFDETIPAVENMATRLGGDGPADLKGASIQLGKALQDPVKGIAALHRVGVDFSDAQKSMIQTMVEHGDIVGAQKVILHEINTEFGGSAEAARKAKGSIGDLGMETHALQGELGKLLNEGLQPIAKALVDGIHFIKDNKDEIIDLAIVVGTTTTAYMLFTNWATISAGAAAIWTGAITAANTVAELWVGFQYALAEGESVWTAAQWALNVAMDANPIGILILAAGALAAGFVWVYHNSEKVRAGFNGLLEIGRELLPVFGDLAEIMAGMMTGNVYLMVKGYKDLYEDGKKFLAGGGFSGAFNKGYNESMAESKKKEKAEHKKDKETEGLNKHVLHGYGNDGEGVDQVVHAGKHKKHKTPTEPGLYFTGGEDEEDKKHAGTFKTRKDEYNPTGKPYSISGVGKDDKSESTKVSGGSSVRNVQVTIGKLIEKLELHTTTLQSSKTADIKRQLTELLVGVVHDSELALGSQ